MAAQAPRRLKLLSQKSGVGLPDRPVLKMSSSRRANATPPSQPLSHDSVSRRRSISARLRLHALQVTIAPNIERKANVALWARRSVAYRPTPFSTPHRPSPAPDPGGSGIAFFHCFAHSSQAMKHSGGPSKMWPAVSSSIVVETKATPRKVVRCPGKSRRRPLRYRDRQRRASSESVT